MTIVLVDGFKFSLSINWSYFSSCYYQPSITKTVSARVFTHRLLNSFSSKLAQFLTSRLSSKRFTRTSEPHALSIVI